MAKTVKPKTKPKTKPKPIKPKKKKVINSFDKGIVNVSSSFNNTIISMSDLSGNIVAWMTAGALGFKGAKKATPFAAAQTARNVIDKSKKFDIKVIEIKVKGVGAGRESAIRTFIGSGFAVTSIKDVTAIPHGGVRPKKVRRV
jgi:small subunit ribosomal protein S11